MFERHEDLERHTRDWPNGRILFPEVTFIIGVFLAHRFFRAHCLLQITAVDKRTE